VSARSSRHPVRWGLALALIGLAACGDRRADAPQREPAVPQRRVIEPPTGTVRPLPPHAIRNDGVGPYLLRKQIAALLDQLPSGPRIARFEIPGLLHHSLIRAEDDTVLIGGEPTSSSSSTTTFIAVIGKEVARTDSGVHVGSTKAELVQALGPLVDDSDRARDPRLAVAAGLRNARMVFDHDRIVAIVVTGDPAAARDPSSEPACPRTAPNEAGFRICLTGAGELVEVDRDELTIRAQDSERVVANLRVPNLVFAAPLRSQEGRDELVIVTRTDEPQQRTWALIVYRLDAGKLVRVVDSTPLYQLSSAQTRWIGADLREVDLYLELASRSDGIEVGGLLTTHTGDKIRDVVLISPVQVARKHGKSVAGEPGDVGIDAGVNDAGPIDAHSGRGSAKL